MAAVFITGKEVLAPLRAAFQRMDGWCPDGLLTAWRLSIFKTFDNGDQWCNGGTNMQQDIE